MFNHLIKVHFPPPPSYLPLCLNFAPGEFVHNKTSNGVKMVGM